MLKITFKELFPVRRKNDFFHGIVKQKEVLLQILPASFRLDEGIDFIENAATEGDRTDLSRFYNFGGPLKKAKAIAHNIIVYYSSDRQSSDFFDTELGRTLIAQTTSLLNRLGPERKSMYIETIDSFLKKIKASKEDGLKGINSNSVIDGIRHLDIAAKVARLVIIASTWSLWEQYSYIDIKPLVDNLACIIVPKSYYGKKGNTLNFDENRLQNRAIARSVLNGAEKHFEIGDFELCVSECSRILSIINAEDEIRGKAYYLMVKCIEEHECPYNEYYNRNEFTRLSMELGCQEAIDEWNFPQIDSLVYSPTRGLQSIDAPNLIVHNSNNAASTAFLSSIPEEYLSNGQSVYVNSTAELLNTIRIDNSTLLLLADEDLQLNFSQFLSFLDYVHAVDTALSATAELVVYLRTDENRYSSLIDLALKHVQEKRLKVHLIDDNKIAAQQLLSRHPLFYPIQSLSAETLNTVETSINYVVVADDANELCEWLVREAFWIGCFSYRCLSLNINVLSPNAEKLERVIRGNYPGIFSGIEYLDAVSKVNVRFESIADVESYELELRLNEFAKINSYYYCVVALQDSIRGLNLSKRLREWSIREKLRSGADMIGVTDLPIIAFYCEDDTTAHLANMISVQSIDKGNSWYNNYRLIPFGMHGEIYSWYNLLGNITEETASCVHLQYCGVDTYADRSVIAKELEGFYYRVYNRDSSMAVAASLPYRLFHMPYRDASTEIRADHIVPRGWSILNGNAYTDIQSLSRMAKMFEQGLKNISNIELLTTYEHARWTRWALSRGWIAATPNEAVAYMISGNPKQQLFIARMHACICSLDDLALLQKTLYEELADDRSDNYAPSGVNEDVYDRFIAMDKKNIVSTPHLLMRTWLHSKNNKD